MGTESWFENGRIQIAAAAAKAVLSYHSERIAIALRYQTDHDTSPPLREGREYEGKDGDEHEEKDDEIIMMSFLRICYEIESGKWTWISRWVRVECVWCGFLYLLPLIVSTTEKKTNKR